MLRRPPPHWASSNPRPIGSRCLALLATLLLVVLASCGKSESPVAPEAALTTAAAEETDSGTAATTGDANASTSATGSNVPDGFTVPENVTIEAGSLEEMAWVPQPGPAVFYAYVTSYRAVSEREPLQQSIGLLEDAPTATRFYMTQLPKEGFEIVSGHNNGLLTVEEIDGTALQYQLHFLHPDGRRLELLVTPNSIVGGQSTVIAVSYL